MSEQNNFFTKTQKDFYILTNEYDMAAMKTLIHGH